MKLLATLAACLLATTAVADGHLPNLESTLESKLFEDAETQIFILFFLLLF